MSPSWIKNCPAQKRSDDLVPMKASGKPIIESKPLKGFSHRKAVYIPVDLPSRILWKELGKNASRNRTTPFGHVFLLGDKAVLYGCVGAPLAVMGLEHFIASGAEEVLILGFCGSLNPDMPTLEVISIDKAYSDEGTSRHYFRNRRVYRSSSRLRQKIEGRLSERNLTFVGGNTVSIDAPYRETREWLLDKRKRGIDVVDMEASAVFALGEYHGVPVAALMIVSDELAGKRWKNVFTYPRMKTKVREYFFPLL